MNEIECVRMKCEASVDVVKLSVIVSHIFNQLGPIRLAGILPQQHMVVLISVALHGCQITAVFFYH